jgi:hypothetical protein
MIDLFRGLTHVVQYRRKDQFDHFDPWHSMAAFDCEGAAIFYCGKQGGATWEYRWIKISETGEK